MKKKIWIVIIGVMVITIGILIVIKNSTPKELTTICRNENEDKTNSDIINLISKDGEIVKVEYESYLETNHSEEDFKELKDFYDQRKNQFNTMEGIEYEYELTNKFTKEHTKVDFTKGDFKEMIEDKKRLYDMKEINIDLTKYLFMIDFENRDLDKQIEKLERFNYVCE